MDTSRIRELLQPFLGDVSLDARQLEQVRLHLELLIKWNAKTNLTAVRKEDEMVTRHFGESFFAARMLLNASVHSVIDLGSGAGFPGVPMAIYSPETKVTLIESQNKKATFLKEVTRALELSNVTVFQGRGEDFAGRAELVVLRAVEKFAGAVQTAAGLIAEGGRIGLMIGVAQRKSLPEDFAWEVGDPIPGAEGRIVIAGRKK